MTYKGDCISALYDIVNTTLKPYGCEIVPEEQLINYSIETICDILAAVPPPRCIGCEGRLYLVPCKGCHQFVCESCRRDHIHTSGSNDYPFEA